MPHPESEHGLRVQLATALRERDEARHGLDEWCKAAMQERARVNGLDAALAAARRECEGLRAILREEMERQHYVAAPGPESEDVDLCGGCGNAWPCEDADCFVFKARALLAAPASAAGEEKS